MVRFITAFGDIKNLVREETEGLHEVLDKDLVVSTHRELPVVFRFPQEDPVHVRVRLVDAAAAPAEMMVTVASSVIRHFSDGLVSAESLICDKP